MIGFPVRMAARAGARRRWLAGAAGWLAAASMLPPPPARRHARPARELR
jgi:hypothetical protein